VVTNKQRPQELCAGSDIDMTSENDLMPSEGDVMENHAIRSYLGAGMNDYACWMWQNQAATNLAVNGYLALCYCTPPQVVYFPVFRCGVWQKSSTFTILLPTSDRAKQLSARVRKAANVFPEPIRFVRRNST
jgi:hypothetical protein